MKIDIVSLQGVWQRPPDLDAVVVIDVLRSFTTAAVALAGGARAIFPVAGPAAGFALWRRRPHALLVGALAGGRPVPGFDHGNSPSELAGAALAGGDVILSTAAGVAGLLRFSDTRAVFGAALCNAAATAAALARRAPRRTALVVTGEWVDRDGDEDLACAELIAAYLNGWTGNPAPYAERVRRSDFGRRFGRPETPHLAAADLDYCARADHYNFAIVLDRAADHELRLLAEPAIPPLAPSRIDDAAAALYNRPPFGDVAQTVRATDS